MSTNPYETKATEEIIAAAHASNVATTKPRVWTVFVAVLLALTACIAIQVVAVIAIFAWYAADGMAPRDVAKELPEKLTTPANFIALLLPGQLVIGLAAIIPAWLSPEPIAARLGLRQPRIPMWGQPIIVIGALLPLSIGIALAHLIALFIPPDPTAAMLYEQMTARWAIPFILFVALAPGFMEELLFRGYFQTRLLQRWPPWVAILVTSAMFGIFHITPHSVVNAFVIGLWLGVLAWRAGSVWPGIMCHAFINGGWNVWQVGKSVWGFPDSPPTIVAVAGGAAIVICFSVSVWLVWFPKDSQASDHGERHGVELS